MRVRYAQARDSFLRLKPYATDGDDAEVVTLRLAEIEYFQGRYSNAREALRPFLASGARQAEARFFYLMSQRGLREHDTFEQLVGALEKDFPESTWAEEALNNLATFYIQEDRDDEADAVLRTMYTRFPRGRYAERAAWKSGWTSYRRGDMSEAVRISRPPPRPLRVRTTGRRGCTGQVVRARRWATAPAPPHASN
jgi:outer membrane protein assembly factor BamD (BamD/ComL family)